jgi:hypothetical protein
MCLKEYGDFLVEWCNEVDKTLKRVKFYRGFVLE